MKLPLSPAPREVYRDALRDRLIEICFVTAKGIHSRLRGWSVRRSRTWRNAEGRRRETVRSTSILLSDFTDDRYTLIGVSPERAHYYDPAIPEAFWAASEVPR